ncbi:hypothetical protein DE146DRAFT_342584 [Phaeosphaeria sp. MPI-PUGE-AT-0046c]|nr:hypothetical protein DE146DRAFT_342584 [Phaeosphaeria sp. MPI-PUGE-AT-0046c]
MTIIYILLLLAAYQNVSAGPLPRENKRQLFKSYTNTTQTPVSVSRPISTSYSSASPSRLVNADTAIVIEPVQRTVVTHVISAVTFLNLKGEPIATLEAETVLSTSYFTPTPQAAPSPSAPGTSSVLPSSTPLVPSVPSLSSKAIPFTSSPALAVPMSSQTAVSGPMNQTSRPAFTYSPEEGQSAAPTISPTSVLNSKPPAGNSTGLPGFDHPGSAPSGAVPPVASLSSAVTSSTRSPGPGTQSTTAPIATGSASNSPVVVTKTEYTTVFPSPTFSTPVDGSELIAGSTPPVQAPQPIQTSSNASPALLSPTPLAPPPVVIITQYTTVAPAPTGGAPKASSTPTAPGAVPSVPSPPVAPQPSSPVAEPPKPIPSSAKPSAPSSRAPAVPAQPSSPAASSLPVQLSSSPTPSPQPPSASSASSPAASSTTTEGPLIITPIAPSQVFTVTVTATEKETVTETATVSVTVRA